MLRSELKPKGTPASTPSISPRTVAGIVLPSVDFEMQGKHVPNS